MLIITARLRLNTITGTINVSAKISLKINVENVASHTCFVLVLDAASSEIWIPNESDNASAIAIIKIPPITISFECVDEFKPTINPRVVIIPDVSPNPSPFLNESFMMIKAEGDLNKFGKDIVNLLTNINARKFAQSSRILEDNYLT